MHTAAVITFIAAFYSTVLAFIVSGRGRTTAHRSFAAGMFVLMIESVFSGLTFDTTLADERFFWELCGLITMAFLPGTWLFFSLSYGRGNYRDFLRRWRFALAAAFLIPISVAVLFRG